MELVRPEPVRPEPVKKYLFYPQRPKKVTAEYVKQEFDRLLAEAEKAETSSDSKLWEKLMEDWNGLRALLSGEHSRLGYYVSQDATDEGVEKEEKYFREKVSPVWETAGFELLTKVLKSRHRAELEKRFGAYYFVRSEASQRTTDPVNVDLRVKEGELAQQYSKIVACGEVVIGGETMTLSRAVGLSTSEKAEVRRESFQKYRKWFIDHHQEVSSIFDEMVKVRHQMALNLGDENFLKLGYAGMQRTDYGRAEVETFREALKKEIVPLVAKLRVQQAKELGTPGLKAWDVNYQPSLHFPQNVVPVGRQLDQAKTLFDRISPVLSKHFERMRTEKLIDLENRKGKRAGAFCTSFPDEGRVAIFCNSTGSYTDVGTLTHEMGHAFQSWESQSIELVDLRWPTLDACEIHSMGMEYLSLRHMDCFFDAEHARRFRIHRWKQSLQLLCHVANVDEFQHWIYENPEASVDERDQAWNRIFDTYQPGLDFTGLDSGKDDAYKWARWYAQGHIFQAPFYYIDYAVAETGAMQLAWMDEQDSGKAVESYLALCRIGGTRSVLDIFKSAGMRSPFDPSLIRDIAAYAAKQIEL